jgi:phosphoribosylamine--glycine ligase
MKVLLIGSGGREHALALALAASPHLTRLIAVPGNPGIARLAETRALDIADHAAILALCQAEAITFVVVGPEMPLVAGLVDRLALAGILAFGPTRAAAELEGSKGFAKELAIACGIPTASYRRFRDVESAHAHLRAVGAPVVVKADGLAAGKGVVVATTLAEAEAAIDAIGAGQFGAVDFLIEEVLLGEEVSFFALCDGTRALALGSAQDHKRVGDGDRGPNTGGMGAYSPASIMTPAMTERIMREIIAPTLAGMAARGTPFRGVLFAGLMIGTDGPKLIEFNVRFGDPECQVLTLRLAEDLLPLLHQCAQGRLRDAPVRLAPQAALTVVLAARGYPGPYDCGSEIRGLEAAAALPGVTIFQAGTRAEAGRLLANGGRVLNVSAIGETLAEAQARAYRAVDLIDWPEGFCRRDIGWRALAAPAGISRPQERLDG